MAYAILDHRGILAVAGEDRRAFLQGLISNDINRVAVARAIYAAFLTPQGKYLHDFFVAEVGDALLLDCETERLADLLRRLSLYRLRSKVDLRDRSTEYAIAAVFGDRAFETFGMDPVAVGQAVPFGGGIAYVDPRLAAAGIRVILPRDQASSLLGQAGLRALDAADYDRHRIELGLPDGSRDMEVEKAILLENGFDELNGVDWDKGCYLGQELTARTKYRGLIRKRLMPVVVDGPMPVPGTPVLFDGSEAGEMRSGVSGRALALMRLEYLEKAAASSSRFGAAGATITPLKQDWQRW